MTSKIIEIWNSLSDSLKKTKSYYKLKKELKKSCSIDVIHLCIDKLKTEFPCYFYFTSVISRLLS